MRKSLFIFSFIMVTRLLTAQNVTLNWVKQLQMKGRGEFVSLSVAIDAAGNVYTTGYFAGTADFDPGAGTYNLTSVGLYDVFILKLDANGNFIWAKQIGGLHSDASSNAIAVDPLGNVYITGVFKGISFDFDPGPNVYNLQPVGIQDAFLVKLDTNGGFIWAKQTGGSALSDETYAKSVAVDATGNVYMAGWFGGGADFDPGAGKYQLTAVGLYDGFITKSDANGNFMWAKQMTAGAGTGWLYPRSIAIDKAGYVYATGWFNGRYDFDPGTGEFNLSTPGKENTFVLKLDASGNFTWAKQLGGAADAYAIGQAIAADGSGNVYITGDFLGTNDFDPGPGTYNLSPAGLISIYVSKLDTDGNFAWAKQLASTTYSTWARSIVADAAGNVYTAGFFQGDGNDPAGCDSLITSCNGCNAAFVTRQDNSGNFIWKKSFGLTTFPITNNSITIDDAGNIYSTGEFTSLVDFDPGKAVLNLTAGWEDVYVHKLSPCNNSSASTLNITSCDPYDFHCKTFSTSGTFIITTENYAGCDSIITLHLNITGGQPVKNTIDTTACGSFYWKGRSVTSSGTYTDTLQMYNGCDSIIILHLGIKPVAVLSVTETICQDQSFAGYTAGGIYVDTLSATNGCDSIRTLHLIVLPLPAAGLLGNDTMLCAGKSLTLTPGRFDTYLWQDGSVQSSITIQQPGLYSVEVSNQCGTAKDEIQVTKGICGVFFPSGFTPNNDGLNDLFKIKGAQELNNYRLSIFNEWGQKIFETTDPAEGWDGTYKGKQQKAGTYIWLCNFKKLTGAADTSMKGTVVLIR